MSDILNRNRIINPFAPTKIRIMIDTDIGSGQSNIKTEPPIHALATLQILIAAAQGILQKIMEAESMIVGKNQSDGKDQNGEKENSDN